MVINAPFLVWLKLYVIQQWKLYAVNIATQDYRRIFVYTLCLINICLSLSDDANKIKTVNIERA